MRQYLDLLEDIMSNGVDRDDRTGTGTRSVFGRQMRFNLKDGFPLLTTKRVYWKGVVEELLWFISGNTNCRYLQDRNVHIWDEWADKNGDLGRIYGAQWRSFGAVGAKGKFLSYDRETGLRQISKGELIEQDNTVDQLAEVIGMIRKNPSSRRLLVVAWNPIELPKMALPPCHCLFQFYVADGKLSCQLYQRSCDVFLGLPFNIASYSLLTHMIASICGLGVGDFIWTGGDTHLYLNHFDQAKTQLKRTPTELPRLIIRNKKESINDFRYDDFELVGYNPQPAIKAQISV